MAANTRWPALRLAGRLLRGAAFFVIALSLQGCLPPDWSFCDCDFRDNFWNHVANDIHMLWDEGGDFISKARDNKTFQGRYLQGPLPEGYDCPMQADVFWKGWPRFGMTRALIEGSMGDLWMPGARDRIKGICMAGHVGLLTICSQHFLVRAAKLQEAGDPEHMRYLEAAYGHMVSLRNMAADWRLRQCMGQQGWPMKVAKLHEYTEKWLGKESLGAQPMAAYMGGRLDPYGMLFSEVQAHTAKSRVDALPDRRPCVPYKNPACWKRKSLLLIETCEWCCSPFEHKTGRGSDWCFTDGWTFEDCCQTDFQDLVCEQKRKGEDGGCVDCAKSVTWNCLTKPEKRLNDAMADYNKKVDKFNELQGKAQQFIVDIEAARQDLLFKEAVYDEKRQDYQVKLQVWSVAYNNVSRMISEGRLNQQRSTWNNTAFALAERQTELKAANAVVANRTEILRQANATKLGGETDLLRNESIYNASIKTLDEAYARLAEARAAQARAEDASAAADAGASQYAAREAQSRDLSLAANRTQEALHAETAPELEEQLAAQFAAEDANAPQVSLDASKVAEREARDAEGRAQGVVGEADRVLQTASAAEQAAIAARDAAAALVPPAEEDLKGWQAHVSGNESAVRKAEAYLDRLQEEERRLKQAFAEAQDLEKALQNASKIADEGAAKGKGDCDRMGRRITVLREHINTLNRSISENLTTVVSAWLSEREEAARKAEEREANPDKGGFGARLLKAAKTALVSMVSSIEGFVETYVVSLKDKESVTELVRAVDDHRDAEKELKRAQKTTADAETNARDAAASSAKATSTREANSKAWDEAVKRLPVGEAELTEAKRLLEEARVAKAASEQRLEAARKVLEERSAVVPVAVKARVDAAQVLEARRADLKARQGELEAATALVAEWTAEVNSEATAKRLAAAQKRIAESKQRAKEIRDALLQAGAAVHAAAARLAASSRETQEALQRRVQKRTELEAASAMALTRQGEVEAAEAAKVLAREVLKAGRIYLAKLIESLLLGEKQADLDEALAEEAARLAVEQKAAAWESRTKKLLGTHQRHLDLLHEQLNLTEKNSLREASKAAFEAAEKAAVDAQSKFETLNQDDNTNNKNIGDTYKEINVANEEHTLAKAGYDEQTPEDRKRSFTTSLQGAGAG